MTWDIARRKFLQEPTSFGDGLNREVLEEGELQLLGYLVLEVVLDELL